MNIIRLLGNKISEELLNIGSDINDVENIPIDKVLSFIEGKTSLDDLNKLGEKGMRRKKLNDELVLPPVMHKSSTPMNHEILSKKGTFIGEGELNGEIFIVNSLEDFTISQDWEGKIIIIENATPEIDVYLDSIKGVITKNGGPLAHICIRAREMKIPAVIGSSYYDEIKEISPESININFSKETIAY